MTKQNTAKAAQPATDLRQRAARARDAAGRFIKRSAPVEAAHAEPDPVLVLIEEHRTAYVEWDRDALRYDAILPGSAAHDAAATAERDSGQRERAAYEALFDARPRTMAGVVALAEYLKEAVPKVTTHIDPADGDRALDTIAAALRGIAQHPDTALFDLGAQFMAAWVTEEAVEVAESAVEVDEEAADWRAYQECKRIAEQIVRTPATTAAGYGIKALLLARYDSENSGPSRPIAPQGSFASDWNVLRQVQEGAARLAAAPDMGFPISPLAAPVTGSPVSGGLIDGRLPCPGHDLSELPIEQLARLYTVVVRAEEVIGSAENAPCFWEAPNTYRTAAGDIINREADRLGQFTSAIAKEMSRRQPVDDDEAQERANMLLAHLIETGGVAEHPELLAEINAKWGA
ncbi:MULTISPECIES: hypothetical protein [unclassified Methylobacterium]|uniref:hypothetical protein n=1 Tax=unclassified Methylobacterium TaxID=2615210 RepID=UPI00226AD4F8|nr:MULTISPECIES: hypothetical protein [unclassified Methylobacterium]